MGAAINNTAILRRTPFLPSVRTLTVGIAAILFVMLCALPTIYMFVVSFFSTDGSFSLANYRLLLTESRQRELFLTSIQLGTGTAVLATAIGVPLGVLLARADLPAKRFLRVALVVPLVLPSYMLALAWIYVGGSTGLVAQLIGRDLLSRWTYSLTGAILVLGLSLYPLSMLATEAAARRVEASLEEAALLVAGPRRTVWSITLPLIAPSIAGAALLTFVLALSEFSVPAVLRVGVFTTEVFTAFAALYDFGAATARATPMLALALIAGIAVNLVVGDRWLTSRRSTRTGLTLPLGRWRALAIAASALVLIFAVVLPLVVLALEAGRLSRITTALNASVQAITNSLLLAVIGATLILVLGLALGYGRGRARARFKELVDLGFIIVFAVPSTVVGVGLIGLWNRSGWPGQVYSSSAIIVIAYLARFVPVAALILAVSVRQIPKSFEEAAELSGASWLRVFFRIVLPQMKTGLAAAWVVAFIFAFGELGATVLVAPPGESTLPVRVYTLIANTKSSEVAALALMQALVILIPLALLGTFASNGGKR